MTGILLASFIPLKQTFKQYFKIEISTVFVLCNTGLEYLMNWIISLKLKMDDKKRNWLSLLLNQNDLQNPGMIQMRANLNQIINVLLAVIYCIIKIL